MQVKSSSKPFHYSVRRIKINFQIEQKKGEPIPNNVKKKNISKKKKK